MNDLITLKEALSDTRYDMAGMFTVMHDGKREFFDRGDKAALIEKWGNAKVNLFFLNTREVMINIRNEKSEHIPESDNANAEQENPADVEEQDSPAVTNSDITEALQARLLYSDGKPVYQAGNYYRLDPGGFVWSCPGSQYTAQTLSHGPLLATGCNFKNGGKNYESKH